MSTIERPDSTRQDSRPVVRLDAVKYWIVCVAMAAGAVIALRSHSILSPKLFLDEFIIRRFTSGELQADGLSSYGTTGWLYKVTGLGGIPDVFPVLSYLVFAAAVLLAITWRGIPQMSFPALALAAGSLLLGGVYLSQYSKEFFVLPLVILLLLARRSIVVEIGWIALALVYAGFVRQYWFIVVALYLLLRLLIPRIRSAWLLIPIVIACLGVMVLAFELILGAQFTSFRTEINAALDFDRTTQIDDLISGDALPLQGLNAMAMMLSIAFPVSLVFSGDVVQLIAGTFVAVCWGLLVLRTPRVVGRPGPGVLPLAFLVAFLLVQTAFEPDFGSYLRHITPHLPLFLALFAATTRPRIGEL